jgi:integrase
MPKQIKVGQLIDQFLASIKTYSAPGTVEWYREGLRNLRYVALGEPISAITDSFLREFIQRFYGRTTTTTQHGVARRIQRLLNWAVAEGLIERSPLKHFRKPPQTRREAFITPDDYAKLVRATNEPYRSAVKFLYHTGARPQEIRKLEAGWLQGNKFVLPVDQSKGKRKSRVIYLDAMALRIAQRLCQATPTGPIFLNADGKPLAADVLGQAITRSCKRAGIRHCPPYAFRHAHVTRLLERGIDLATVAAISGNSVAMIVGFYSHVGDNDKRLSGIVNGA